MIRVTTTSAGCPEAAGIEWPLDADVADARLSYHEDVEPYLALNSSFQRLAGVVGANLHKQSWRNDAATFTIRAAGQGASATTRSVTLPIRNREIPRRPWVPSTTKPARKPRAVATMCREGSPSQRTVVTRSPRRRARAAKRPNCV